MRLVCPNCDAQYQVDDAAIPEAGRDVQCSNCGHAWFQLHPAAEAELADEEDLFAPIAVAPEPEPVAEREPRIAPATAAPPFADDGEDEDADGPPVPAPRPLNRALDDSLMAVLREEAERESAARRAESRRGIEVQPDLGLVAPAVGAAAARRAAQLMDRDGTAARAPDPVPPRDMPADPLPADPDPPRPGATRRDLLPDIEEINSTLRASTDRRGTSDAGPALPEAPADRRRGFRSGFMLVLLVVVVLVAAYVTAPRIAQQVPAMAPAIAAYVATVDQARLGIDATLKAATIGVQSLTSGTE